MTEVDIIKADALTTRKIIIELHGGVLTDAQAVALAHCVGPTSDLWLGLINGRPVCAWGLVPPTMLSDRAYLWLYATPAIDEHKFLFIRRSMRVVEDLRQLYPVMYGVCDVTNPRAIRWLKRLGAKFSDPSDGHVPFVIGGHNG
jgi:hypothetical protein